MEERWLYYCCVGSGKLGEGSASHFAASACGGERNQQKNLLWNSCNLCSLQKWHDFQIFMDSLDFLAVNFLLIQFLFFSFLFFFFFVRLTLWQFFWPCLLLGSYTIESWCGWIFFNFFYSDLSVLYKFRMENNNSQFYELKPIYTAKEFRTLSTYKEYSDARPSEASTNGFIPHKCLSHNQEFDNTCTYGPGPILVSPCV